MRVMEEFLSSVVNSLSLSVINFGGSIVCNYSSINFFVRYCLDLDFFFINGSCLFLRLMIADLMLSCEHTASLLLVLDIGDF